MRFISAGIDVSAKHLDVVINKAGKAGSANRFENNRIRHVQGFYQHLINDQGLKPLQAICAVMRKLLHAIHGMLRNGKPFDNTRFYALPEGA